MILVRLEPAILGPEDRRFNHRPRGRCLLATKPYEPVLGKLSSALGRQNFPSLQEGMQDRPYELKKKKRFASAARNQKTLAVALKPLTLQPQGCCHRRRIVKQHPLVKLCPGSCGDGLEIQWAEPRGVRLPPVSFDVLA
jgi:hypothetical protein